MVDGKLLIVCSLKILSKWEEVWRHFDVQSNAFMPEKPLRFAGGCTAEAATLNFSKYLIYICSPAY